MKYTIKFDRTNENCILIRENGSPRLHHIIATPPCKSGTDLISLGDTLKGEYMTKFNGLVVITNPTVKLLYIDGAMIDMIERNIE